MDEKRRTAVSKFLSYVLRHEPAAAGIALDAGGWVAVDVLLEACAQHGRRLSRADLDEVVATSPKQRFALSDDGQRIRANQGHSIAVDLGYEPAEPPDVLFHGTVARLLPSIREGYGSCVTTPGSKEPDWDRLFETAAGQSGYVTTKQAAEAGYSTHLLRKHIHAGHVTRPQRGIYRLVRSPVGEHEELVPAWLWSEQAGVLSGLAILARQLR